MDRLFYNISDYMDDMDRKKNMDESEEMGIYKELGEAVAEFLNGFAGKTQTIQFTYIALKAFIESISNSPLPSDEDETNK